MKREELLFPKKNSMFNGGKFIENLWNYPNDDLNEKENLKSSGLFLKWKNRCECKENPLKMLFFLLNPANSFKIIENSQIFSYFFNLILFWLSFSFHLHFSMGLVFFSFSFHLMTNPQQKSSDSFPPSLFN